MTVSELRDRYHEVFGEDTNARNKPWLIKRIAWPPLVEKANGVVAWLRSVTTTIARVARSSSTKTRPRRSVELSNCISSASRSFRQSRRSTGAVGRTN
ncbi:MAG: hypothetical protein ACKO9Q_20440 [Pirellula sp.]